MDTPPGAGVAGDDRVQIAPEDETADPPPALVEERERLVAGPLAERLPGRAVEGVDADRHLRTLKIGLGRLRARDPDVPGEGGAIVEQPRQGAGTGVAAQRLVADDVELVLCRPSSAPISTRGTGSTRAKAAASSIGGF